MGRTKVQQELIRNEITRKITFKKRKIGLLKKLKEITTLCGVIACGIIFHNFNGKGKEDQPEVWPSVPEANDVLKKFKDFSKKKKEKYMFNHETLLEESLRKMAEKLNDETAKNKWMEMELLLMEDLPPISEEDLHGGNQDYHAKGKLNCKCRIVKDLLKKVTKRIEDLESGNKNK
ncbi:MADS-box transcription factor PHERES 2 [Linum perenne]